ncbi:NAD(P)H dehydrogenase B4 [Artemisia annua]|uniref:NAD(P)H dehydrogenase B4 n=1 Tax=Artemisia annua TaxID=35608 RepID=A0A2U1LV22_ARTAN|nr:NAD(P)H dehydrogenase B4 [Artemisia annua]
MWKISKNLTNDIIERYPQIALHLKIKKLKNFVQLLKSNQDGASKQIDIEKFKSALSEVDTKMKSLPPTAYTHLGQFAPLGGELKKPISEWGPQKFPSTLVHLTLDGGTEAEATIIGVNCLIFIFLHLLLDFALFVLTIWKQFPRDSNTSKLCGAER